MMQATWNFIKNNRAKIFVASTAVVGFIGLRRYFSNLEKQWEQSQSKNFVAEVHKKGAYFDEAIRIGNEMANKQFTIIIKKLQEMFNIFESLNKIKTAQNNNVALSHQLKHYEELKIDIFSYIIAEIYSISFLITYLRVQFSMISGVMYYENQIDNSTISNNRSGSTNMIKDANSRYFMFISLLENFQEKGIEHLVETIRKSVSCTFQSIKVTDKVTLKDLMDSLKNINLSIQNQFDQLIEENVLLVYCSNREQTIPDETQENQMLNELKACSKFVDEMIDIAKLPDFRKVIENCVDIGFSNLYDFISECFIQLENQNFTTNNKSSMDQNDSIESRHFINPHQINVLLIKLLPLIWAQVHHSSQNKHGGSGEFVDKNHCNDRNALLVQYLLCSDSLTCFTANIYEAFCNEK